MSADPYVLGCCLYQIGHTSRFEAHRHIGFDNEGRPLTLMQRIQSLNAAPALPAGQIRRPAEKPVRVVVQNADGEPIAGAKVYLVGRMNALGDHPRATLYLPDDEIVWDKWMTGLTGNRWRCYQGQVVQNVAGMPYSRFKAQVVEHNPALADSDFEFLAEERYLLPRNRQETVPIRWDRNITGFAGNRWQAWLRLVAGRVLGISWADFADRVLVENPQLAEDAGSFQADKAYCLPWNPDYDEVALFENSGKEGEALFTDVPEGDYRLIIKAAGLETQERDVTVIAGQSNVVIIDDSLPPARRAFRAVGKSHVGVAGGRFMLGDHPFPRFAGVNLPQILYLGDHDITRPDDDSLSTYLNNVQALGAKVIRCFVPHHSRTNQETVDRLLTLLAELDRRDMYLIPSLIDLYHNVGAYPQGLENAYVDFRDSGERMRLGPEFFRSGYKEPVFQEYLRTVIRGVPLELSHTILCWEIGNELKMEDPGNNPPDTKHGDPAQFVNFCRDMASIIKQLDPHPHLVTTGMISTQHVYLKHQSELIRQLYDDSQIDFLTVHVYYNRDAGPPEQMIPNNEPDFDAVFAEEFGKPIIVEEAGIQRGSGDFHARLAADLHRWLESAVYEGRARQQAAGYMIWRPHFGLMASGDFEVERNVLQPLLGNLAGMAPAAPLAEPAVRRFDIGLRQSLRDKLGIDLNRPIQGRTPSEVVSNPDLVAETGAGWVRLNFVLQDASGPDDAAWLATYDTIIDGLLSAGLRIYGLIGGEAVKTRLDSRLLHSVQQKTNDGSVSEAEEWIEEYVSNFHAIVKRFSDRVSYFESFNEPNNWAIPGISAAVVHPTWYAHMLDRIDASIEPEFPAVTLVSGPLLGHFHHQPSGESAALYLRQAYDEGRRLGWHATGRFPFDGIGYHLYLKPNQHSDFLDGIEHHQPMSWESHAERVRGYYDGFNEAILDVVRMNEGSQSNKQLYISEMGWDAQDNSPGWLSFQANSVGLGLDLLASDSRVALGFWFCTRDFPGNSMGLFLSGVPLRDGRKPAYDAFQAFMQSRAEGALDRARAMAVDARAHEQRSVRCPQYRNARCAPISIPLGRGRYSCCARSGSTAPSCDTTSSISPPMDLCRRAAIVGPAGLGTRLAKRSCDAPSVRGRRSASGFVSGRSTNEARQKFASVFSATAAIGPMWAGMSSIWCRPRTTGR